MTNESTYEIARRCPRCEQPGQQTGKQAAPERHMGMIHIFMCANERCDRAGRTWIIQVRPDGTIPEPTLHREKQFPKDGEAKARTQAVRERLDAMNRQSLGGQ